MMRGYKTAVQTENDNREVWEMKIAVIGAGAMGSVYGGHLSLHNEVYLIDTNETIVQSITQNGLTLQENGTENLYYPKAVTSSASLEIVDLVVVFVKAMYSEAALKGCKNIIGPDTYVLTLQNGSGHENILEKVVDKSRIIIGTTEDNGAVLAPGHVRHGGVGNTNVGMPAGDAEEFLPKLKEAFESCGFHVRIHDNIQQLIWNKLFTNVSLSTTTALLQVPMGYIAKNEFAWQMVCSLLHEAVTTAHGLGLEADEGKLQEEIRRTSQNSPEGITSICADIRAGRKTEVDTISGSVCMAAKKLGIPVPCQEFAVSMIHALEGRGTL